MMEGGTGADDLCPGFWMLDDKTSVGPRSPLAATISLSALNLGLPSNYVIQMLAGVNPEAIASGQGSPDRFSTTRWSLVLACAGSGAGEETAREALDQLCKNYWRPVFAFICRSGHPVPDAQDLTQDFFVRSLKVISSSAPIRIADDFVRSCSKR